MRILRLGLVLIGMATLGGLGNATWASDPLAFLGALAGVIVVVAALCWAEESGSK